MVVESPTLFQLHTTWCMTVVLDKQLCHCLWRAIHCTYYVDDLWEQLRSVLSFKGDHSALHCVLEARTFATSLCRMQKGPIRAPFLLAGSCVQSESHWSILHLCAQPFLIPHSDTHFHDTPHISPTPQLVSYCWTSFISVSAFFACFHLWCLSRCFTKYCGSLSPPLFSIPGHYAKLPEKGC